MKTSFLTALALGAALFTAQPAFAYDHGRGGGGGGARTAVVGGGARPFAAAGTRSFSTFHSGGSRSLVAGRSFSTFSGSPGFSTFSRGRSFSTGSPFAARGSRSFRSTPSIAFGGTSRSFARGGGGRSFAFASRNGWNPGHQYFWHGHHYRYYNNAWFIVDPYDYGYGAYYDPGYYSPTYDTSSSDYNTTSVEVQVQQALANAGYYQGPIDGIVGPGTSNAIAAFQRDNGLPVTGTITASLIDTLNQG
jgi:hypothetical protein